MDTGGPSAGKLVTMGSDAMGAETGSAAEVAGGLDEEAMLIEIKLRNQCKLQQVAWDNRDDCQVNISLVTVCSRKRSVTKVYVRWERYRHGTGTEGLGA